MFTGLKTWLLVLACLLLAGGCSDNGSGATNDVAKSDPTASGAGEKPPFQPDQKEAVAAMKRFGVSIGYDDAGRVIRLDFSNTKATNPWLKHLSGLPNVERLDLRQTEITDAGLVHLSGLGRLSELRLPTAISNTGLSHLKNIQFLESLYLDQCQITGSGLAEIKEAPRLQILILSGTQVGDDGLGHLSQFKQLEWLNLSDTQVTDRGLARLQLLPKLKTLNLFLLSGVTDEGLTKLAAIPTLKELDLGFTGVTNSGVDRLKKALPELRISH